MSKRKNGIVLSPKYGVNPSIAHCEVCGKELGITLFGKLKGDKQAPKDIHMGLCEDCQNVIDQKGLLIIEVRDGETGDNPYRTGRIVGITKDAREKMFNGVTSSVVYMEEKIFGPMFGNYCKKE